MAPPASFPVLLYDGGCGLCATSVQFVLRHDPRGPLRFASLQSSFGQVQLARHAELRGVDSMVWIDPTTGGAAERIYVRSDAVLRICGYLGGWWTIGLAGRVVPKPLRDGLYRLVARHRHRLPGRGACLVPTAQQSARFLS